MTATTPAPVEVTQADRDALERIDDALGFLMDDERELVLQAFAAHRIQALSARPAQADLVEALEWLDFELHEHGFNKTGNARQIIARAITRATGSAS